MHFYSHGGKGLALLPLVQFAETFHHTYKILQIATMVFNCPALFPLENMIEIEEYVYENKFEK